MFHALYPDPHSENHGHEFLGTTILLIILIAVLLAVLPTWPYSRTWGPFPSGFVGAIIALLIFLLVLEKV